MSLSSEITELCWAPAHWDWNWWPLFYTDPFSNLDLVPLGWCWFKSNLSPVCIRTLIGHTHICLRFCHLTTATQRLEYRMRSMTCAGTCVWSIRWCIFLPSSHYSDSLHGCYAEMALITAHLNGCLKSSTLHSNPRERQRWEHPRQQLWEFTIHSRWRGCNTCATEKNKSKHSVEHNVAGKPRKEERLSALWTSGTITKAMTLMS